MASNEQMGTTNFGHEFGYEYLIGEIWVIIIWVAFNFDFLVVVFHYGKFSSLDVALWIGHPVATGKHAKHEI